MSDAYTVLRVDNRGRVSARDCDAPRLVGAVTGGNLDLGGMAAVAVAPQTPPAVVSALLGVLLDHARGLEPTGVSLLAPGEELDVRCERLPEEPARRVT